MFGKRSNPKFDGNFQVPERHGRFPRIALRQRSSDHPMIMFATLVSVGFASMALMMPAAGAAMEELSGAPVKIADTLRDTGKTARLAPMSPTDRACWGQAWGTENQECLLAIAKEAGRTEMRKVRMIANAEPLRTVPNIF